MCGIAGVFDPRGKIQGSDLEALGEKMHPSLAHRGPDQHGVWIDASEGLLLTHRRLSIIDLSGGGQPMHSLCGRFVITYNGELYNYRALREALEKEGARFRDSSDTEVLLAALSEWPLEKALQEFVGMYALAVWDKQTQRLILARDRMGEKPLYYGWINQVFVFASELKAFKSVPEWKRELNLDALALFFRYNYVPDPHSIFRDIYKLPAASYVVIDKAVAMGGVDRVGLRKYWHLDMRPESVSHQKTPDEWKKDLRHTLQQTVSDKLIADVPIGSLLSGGVDSSLITALSQEASLTPIDTFSIGFHDRNHDETRFARAVAKHLGTAHHEMFVSGRDALSVVPELPSIYDEPFADSSQIPTILVSRLARRSIKVALSGDGGDELFAGYNRHAWGQRLFRLRSILPTSVGEKLGALCRTLRPETWNRLGSRLSPLMGGVFSNSMIGDKIYKASLLLEAKTFEDAYLALVSSWQDSEDLVRGATTKREEGVFRDAQESDLGKIEKMLLRDTLGYLPGDILTKVDRASMSTGLEVRAPFLDHRVVEFAASCPLELKLKQGTGKWILRQVLYDYVPQTMIDRPKMGFAVPLGTWLRGPLKDWASDLMTSDLLKKQGWLDEALVTQKWEEHQKGIRNWENQLWGVLMFQSWLHAEGLA